MPRARQARNTPEQVSPAPMGLTSPPGPGWRGSGGKRNEWAANSRPPLAPKSAASSGAEAAAREAPATARWYRAAMPAAAAAGARLRGEALGVPRSARRRGDAPTLASNAGCVPAAWRLMVTATDGRKSNKWALRGPSVTATRRRPKALCTATAARSSASKRCAPREGRSMAEAAPSAAPAAAAASVRAAAASSRSSSAFTLST
mmetsp:Transcript_8502/g.33606  ORF Transcript_8502/g.33606 Transcript_8502/m.33606 type:complete len:204 (+) Transcript_8502:211-822(+)